MLNKVTLIGYLGDDVELHDGNNQRAHASLATSELWNADGKTQERTESHQLTVWGKAAEHFARYRKGDLLYVEGKIRNRRWEQDGQTFYRTEIHLDTYRTLRRRADAPKKGANGRKTKAA
jgi:single-strand DNA-binding protein